MIKYKAQGEMKEAKTNNLKLDAAPKRAKHIELNDAIKNISRLKEKTNGLLLKIINKDEPEKCVDKVLEREPSLEELLNEFPDRIRSTCEEIDEIMEEIDTLLF